MHNSEFPFNDDMVPDKTIRREGFAKAFHVDKETQTIVKEYPEYATKYANNALNTIRNSSTRVKDFIPETMIVIGKNHYGETRALVTMEYVTGTDINKLPSLTEEEDNHLDDLLIESLKFAQENGVFPDILNGLTRESDKASFRNIIVGTTKKNPESRPYVVDIWPLQPVSEGGMEYIQNSLAKALSLLEEQMQMELCPKTKAQLLEPAI